MPQIRTTEVLQTLAQRGGFILFEKGAKFGGPLKDNVITLNTPAYPAPVELPRVMFDDLSRQSFIQQDGPEKDYKIKFKLSRDGEAQGWAGVTRVYQVKDGPQEQKGPALATLPLAECVQKLGLKKSDFIGSLSGPSPRFNAHLSASDLRDYRHVVVTLHGDEDGWPAGFYWLRDLTPGEARRRLGIDALA
jgi:hypothetical protein